MCIFPLPQKAVQSAFAAAAKDLGTISVLVYNASGGGFGKTVMEIDPKDLIQSFSISCVGALNCAQVGNGCGVSYRTEKFNFFTPIAVLRPPFQACLQVKDSEVTRFRKKGPSFFLLQHPRFVAVRVPHSSHVASTHSAHSPKSVSVSVSVSVMVLCLKLMTFFPAF